MRCRIRRLLRSVALTLLCLYSVYVAHTVFTFEDDSLLPSVPFLKVRRDKAGQLHQGGGGRGSVTKRLPQHVDVLNDRAHGAGAGEAGQAQTLGTARGSSFKESESTAVRSKEAEGLSIEATKGPESKRQGAAGPDVMEGRDVSNGTMQQGDDVDPYADVTYPPYVETLPPGVNGQDAKEQYVDKKHLSEEQQREFQEKWDKNGFNQYASDLLPVRRELPDFRSAVCQRKQYPSVLPNVSVVIIFHNEAWSVLLRSVHSILDRTEPHLLVEIILVDDFSSMDHLKRPLDKYFRNHPKVKIVRAPKRGGLIKARLLGFAVAKGEVVVFLDSHIECTKGWAEPLLWMISENYRTVPFPLLDMITANDLTYIPRDSSPHGVFSIGNLIFGWAQLRRSHLVKTDPKPSPTMPGGLFAISRKWFQELGTYDPELDYWGGENMELSFKAWMCGGSIVIAECSHIGHIFRAKNPITWTQKLGNRNYVRVAMVWMDEYKDYFFERVRYRLSDYGNITDRLAIRDRLKCHNFAWYVDNVYPELKQQIVLNATYAGEFRHEQSGLCLDKMDDSHPGPGLFSCHHAGMNQFCFLRDEKYLQVDNWFLCKKGADSIKLCNEDRKEEWSYNPATRHLVHVATGQCLQKSMGKEETLLVKLVPCQENSFLQRWILERRKEFKHIRKG